MAIFDFRKEKKKEETSKKMKSSAVPEKKDKLTKGASPDQSVSDVEKKISRERKTSQVEKVGGNVSSVLIRPRITEKATTQAEKNVYVFEVSTGASKRDIKDAIVNLYKVHPVKVHVVKILPRKVVSRMRGTRGTKAGYKKAYVYLKEGDRIEII